VTNPDPRRPERRREPESTPLDPEELGPIEQAAPPDDGGTRGSFTRPIDATLAPGSSEAETGPDLHWSPETGAQRPRPDTEA
jgi:hypothetical protein